MEKTFTYTTNLRSFLWFLPGMEKSKKAIIDLKEKSMKSENYNGKIVKIAIWEAAARRLLLPLVFVYLLFPRYQEPLVFFGLLFFGALWASIPFLFASHRHRLYGLGGALIITVVALISFYFLYGGGTVGAKAVARYIVMMVPAFLGIYFLLISFFEIKKKVMKNMFKTSNDVYIYWD
jgi:hypothetical protein